MKTITYIGAHDSVLVPALGQHVANGESVESPDEIADSLLAQGSYPEHLAADGITTVPAGPGTEWVEGPKPVKVSKPKGRRANPSPTRPGAGNSQPQTLPEAEEEAPSEDTPDAAA